MKQLVTMWAKVDATGTAMAETAVCDRHRRESAIMRCLRDCTHHDALQCQLCAVEVCNG